MKRSAAKQPTTGKAFPIRTLRIERPYGGEIVLEAMDVPEIIEYLDRARDWFAMLPDELPIFQQLEAKF